MPHETEQCTCWTARTETGETHTAAWLEMHQRIAVTTKDGQRIEGRPDGSVWFEGEQPGIGIEQDDGLVFDTPLSEVETITPLVAPDPVEILECVARTLRRPFAVPDGETGWTAIAGPHEVLEIEVKVRRCECMSSTPSLPRFRILVEDITSRDRP